MATFNPNKPVFRGVTSYRSSAPDVSKLEIDELERDTKLDLEQELPPEMPYNLSFASTNTFKSVDKSPSELKALAVEVLEKLKVDVLSNVSWELQCEMYPDETKTSFLVKIFNDKDGSHKDSFLVEVQLIQGNRFAFEHMCTYFRNRMALDDAHTGFEGFGFDSEFDSEPLPEVYEPAQWKPLPLPASLSSTTCSEDLSMFAPVELEIETEVAPIVAVLAENTMSDFADVRRTGWQELAQVTGEKAMASALLDVTISGKDGLTFVADTFVEQEVHDELADDQRRCVMKTLLNLCRCRRDSSLAANERVRAKIMMVARDGHNTFESRSIALQLLQELGTPASDREYLTTLESCSVETGRVGERATQTLQSLAVC